MKENRFYGYVRVSSKDQNEARQMTALASYKELLKQNIYLDKMSGKNFERPNYQKMVNKLKKGDVLIIKSIDRLGRDYNEILEQWRFLIKVKEIDVIVIDMPLLNTLEQKDLIKTVISDIVLQLLSYVAQQEREFIRVRQEEGILEAKSKGVRFGRPPKNRGNDYQVLKYKWRLGDITCRQAGAILGVSHVTFYRWVISEEKKITKYC